MVAYVGCQADKMNDAIAGMNELLNELPKTEGSFKNAQSGLMKNIETERITEDAIITDYLTAQQKGIDHDLRQDNYAQYGNLTLDDVYKFHKETLAGQHYTYCVIASDKRINADELKKYGALQTLSVSERVKIGLAGLTIAPGSTMRLSTIPSAGDFSTVSASRRSASETIEFSERTRAFACAMSSRRGPSSVSRETCCERSRPARAES